MTNVALEALIQRGESPFFKAVTDLIATSMNALESQENLSKLHVSATLRNIDFAGQMKAVVKKHFGLNLSQVIIEESALANLAAGADFTKKAFKQLNERKRTVGSMMELINRHYDDRAGKFTDSTGLQDNFTFSLSMNTSLWSTRNTDGSYYFTARELAAVVLHEVGHLADFTLHIWRARITNTDASDIVTYVNETADREVILALIAALKKSNKLEKNWTVILKEVEKYFSTTNNPDNPDYLEALSALSTIVAADTAFRILWNVRFIDPGISQRLNTVDTKSYYVDQERAADDFMARHGCYADFVSCITKLHKLSGSSMNLVLRQVLWWGLADLFGTLFSFTSMFNIAAEDIYGGYDPIIRRVELVVETAKHAFHDATLDEATKDEIAQHIALCEQYITAYKKTNHQRVRSTLNNWKHAVLKTGRILGSPVQNRLSQDYERVQNATRSLSRNPLYYMSQR